LEQKVATEPADLIALLTSLGTGYGRIGIEAGPLSQTTGGVSSQGRLIQPLTSGKAVP
jgi:hypothetical protein